MLKSLLQLTLLALLATACSKKKNTALAPGELSEAQKTAAAEVIRRKEEAVKAGVKRQTVNAALDGVQYAPDIIRIDSGQSFFSQAFLDFQTKLATPGRVSSGIMQMKKHAEDPNRVRVVVSFHPMNEFLPSDATLWQSRCEQVNSALRMYLMASG